MKSLSRVRLCDHMDCSLPGFSVHGIFQARVLEWVAIAFSKQCTICSVISLSTRQTHTLIIYTLVSLNHLKVNSQTWCPLTPVTFQCVFLENKNIFLLNHVHLFKSRN